jgi:cytochrome b involved in lipid metabolism
VYDFTDPLEEHLSGVEAIVDYGGRDGTETFESVHSLEMLDGFTPMEEMADNSR